MGHVVGSHSRSHPPRISRCRPKLLVREWSESVETLSEILERPVTAAAGICALLTSEPVVTTRMVARCTVLGRFCVTRRTSATEVAAIASGQCRPQLRQLAVWNAKKGVKTFARRAYPRFGRVILERLEPRWAWRGTAQPPAGRATLRAAARSEGRTW